MKSEYDDQTLFVADTNEVGFCFSRDMRSGDSIVLVTGRDFPLLLRHADYEQSRFTFVGPSAINGMLEGDLWPEYYDESITEIFVLIERAAKIRPHST